MSKVRVHITVSVDSYVAGPNQSLEHPLGEGGGSLHDWAFELYLRAGLVDELELHIVPLLLGGGARLFDGVGPDLKLEQVRAVDAPGVTHVKYRVLGRNA